MQDAHRLQTSALLLTTRNDISGSDGDGNDRIFCFGVMCFFTKLQAFRRNLQKKGIFPVNAVNHTKDYKIAIKLYVFTS
jgi:hypothetical protein